MRRTLLAVLVGLASVAAAPEPRRLYLHVDGVQGEARGIGHAGWVEIVSLRLPEARGPAHAVVITKTVDRASPRLMACAARSCDLGAVMVDEVGPQGTRRMIFTHAVVESIRRLPGEGRAAQETITLHFDKVETSLAEALPDKLRGPLPIIKDNR
jgi:type VI protein secretion system component Hcp